MAVNKVQYGNQTIMDITDTSATPNGVVEGQVFYNAAGTRSTGTLGDATQSTHGLMSAADKTKLDAFSAASTYAPIAQLPSTMTGATSNAAGTSGLVPIPPSDSQDKCLTGDGTWKDKNLVILEYGISTWATFYTAYQAHQPILCHYHLPGASNGREGRYSQFSYYNIRDANRYSETLERYLDSVEFQYYRSPPSSEAGTYDQLFCYKLYEDDYWEIITRNVIAQTMTGATSSVNGSSGAVPAPTSTDINKFLAGDGTWKSGGLPMVILSYGNSTWNDFLNAYNNNAIVYCRASSNDNPASGSQTRMAFMAYVNYATLPSEVEFQYYRSLNSHSITKMGDEVYVYKLNSSGTWSVTKRYASLREIKIGTKGNLSVSWSNNQATIDGGLPAVTSDDNGKILQVVNGAWALVTPS